MGQQEDNHETRAPGQSAQVSQNHSPADCLDELRDALDLHRLVFLCVGCAVGLPSEYPRKPPRVMGPGKIPFPKKVTKEQLAGAGSDFILKLRPTLERYALRALDYVGQAKGQYWGIDTDGAYYLEGTSDRILAVCRALSTEDVPGAFADVVDAAIRVTHDENRPLWKAGRVRWEYLGELDTVIKAAKIATVRMRRTAADSYASKEPSGGRRDTGEGPRLASLPIPYGPADVNAQSMKWDVFISHASEDKEAFVRALAEVLRKENIRVWFDEFALTVGDSLRRSIDHGLASSRYGIVVISPSFLQKEWPQKELDGLAAREVDGRKVILPVWHNIDAETVRQHSPLLADRVATSTDKGVQAVVADLMKAMQ
jgi:hypothetical protein